MSGMFRDSDNQTGMLILLLTAGCLGAVQVAETGARVREEVGALATGHNIEVALIGLGAAPDSSTSLTMT